MERCERAGVVVGELDFARCEGTEGGEEEGGLARVERQWNLKRQREGEGGGGGGVESTDDPNGSDRRARADATGRQHVHTDQLTGDWVSTLESEHGLTFSDDEPDVDL